MAAQNGAEYDEEDVEQLEREIENVMRRSNLGNESGLLYGSGGITVDDTKTVNMTVINDSYS